MEHGSTPGPPDYDSQSVLKQTFVPIRPVVGCQCMVSVKIFLHVFNVYILLNNTVRFAAKPHRPRFSISFHTRKGRKEDPGLKADSPTSPRLQTTDADQN